MATILRHGAPVARRRASVFDFLNRILVTLWTWRFRSRTRRRLAELDDHLLRDIGMDHRTLEREIAKPFWQS